MVTTILGILAGIHAATYGAYKDGIIASGHTESAAFLLLASIGTMRMLLELLFKILVNDYVPGKFKSMTARFPVWANRRAYFLMPYTATWMFYLVLLSKRAW